MVEGNYELELLFADTRQKLARSVYLLGKDKKQIDAGGQQVGFDMLVNGKSIETDFLPGKEFGFFTALRRSYLVKVGKDGLHVKFQSKDGNTFLSGIRLRKL